MAGLSEEKYGLYLSWSKTFSRRLALLMIYIDHALENPETFQDANNPLPTKQLAEIFETTDHKIAHLTTSRTPTSLPFLDLGLLHRNGKGGHHGIQILCSPTLRSLQVLQNAVNFYRRLAAAVEHEAIPHKDALGVYSVKVAAISHDGVTLDNFVTSLNKFTHIEKQIQSAINDDNTAKLTATYRHKANMVKEIADRFKRFIDNNPGLVQSGEISEHTPTVSRPNYSIEETRLVTGSDSTTVRVLTSKTSKTLVDIDHLLCIPELRLSLPDHLLISPAVTLLIYKAEEFLTSPDKALTGHIATEEQLRQHFFPDSTRQALHRHTKKLPLSKPANRATITINYDAILRLGQLADFYHQAANAISRAGLYAVRRKTDKTDKTDNKAQNSARLKITSTKFDDFPEHLSVEDINVALVKHFQHISNSLHGLATELQALENTFPDIILRPDQRYTYNGPLPTHEICEVASNTNGPTIHTTPRTI